MKGLGVWLVFSYFPLLKLYNYNIYVLFFRKSIYYSGVSLSFELHMYFEKTLISTSIDVGVL